MATNAYAEDNKVVKRSMYRPFKVKELTKEEMLSFIGVFRGCLQHPLYCFHFDFR